RHRCRIRPRRGTGRSLLSLQLVSDLGPRPGGSWVTMMSGQPSIEFGPLRVGDRQGLRMLGDTVPDGFDELDAVFNAPVENLLELAWAHAKKSTPVKRSTQSARITLGVTCGARRTLPLQLACARRGAPAGARRGYAFRRTRMPHAGSAQSYLRPRRLERRRSG